MVEQRPMPSNRVVTGAGPRPAAIAGMTPKEVLGILRRHLLKIVILTILGFVLGGATWQLLKMYAPRYTARTYIEVLPPGDMDPMTIGTIQVQRDILYGHRLSMANIIKQQRTLEKLLDRDKVKDTEWYAHRGRSVRRAVAYLERYFLASAHRNSDFVEIAMTCRKDEESALIVNEMLDLFLTEQGVGKQGEIGKRLAGLEEQRKRLDQDVRQADTALDDVRTASDITDLDRLGGRYFRHTFELKLDQLELEKSQVELAMTQIRAEIDTLRRLADGEVTVVTEHEIEMDPVMLVLAEQRAFQDARLTGVLTKFGENHREVRQVRELIRGIEEKRNLRKGEIANQTRRANLANSQDRLIAVTQRFEELEKLRQEAQAKKEQLDLARVQYERRLKIRDERVAMLDSVKEQIEKLKIIFNDPEAPKVRAVGLAPKPLQMVTSRQWWFWFPGGTVLGFLLGLGLAFLLELANDKVRMPRDIIRYVHVPLLGVIPDSAEDRGARGVDLAHIVSQAPYSLISESYRRCRANLKLSGSGESMKTLVVTSGSAGDGKTCVAANLATAFVAEEKKVLLIDANFRQPSLAKLFARRASGDSASGGVDAGYGLSSVLMGQCAARDAIRSSGIEGLHIMDSGLLPPNPAELLDSARMDDLLQEQRNNYSYIIIDSAPVLLVSDAKVLARLADATMLVFNAAVTRRGAAQRTVRELKAVDARIIGCVLFGARALKGGYFQEQYKSYQRYQSMQVAGSPA